MKKAPVHAIYKRYDAFSVIHMARSRAFAGMKWKFFGARKRRERTFIHNLCPLCGRRWGASSADRVGRDPCRREVRIAPGGARGPRPTGCGGRMGRTGSFAPTRFVRDVGDAVPYKIVTGHCKKGADKCPPFTFLLYMTALSATMRCKNTAPACQAPHGHR